MAFHHAPDQCPANRFDAMGAVHIADAMGYLTAQSGRDAMVQRLSTAYLERFGLLERLKDSIDVALESAHGKQN